jgi:hypothetical protein
MEFRNKSPAELQGVLPEAGEACKESKLEVLETKKAVKFDVVNHKVIDQI